MDKTHIDFEILPQSKLIWSSKFSLESIVTPTHFTESLTFNGDLHIYNLTLGIRWVLLGGIINTCDFSGLTVILFALVHSKTFCNSRFIFSAENNWISCVDHRECISVDSILFDPAILEIIYFKHDVGTPMLYILIIFIGNPEVDKHWRLSDATPVLS